MRRIPVRFRIVLLVCLGVALLPAAGAAAAERPFPHHAELAPGMVLPNHVTREQMDAAVESLYDAYMAAYLRADPVHSSRLYICYIAENCVNQSGPVTVSEATGYGMLLTALMAGHDPEAQERFDGLYRHAKTHPSSTSPHLMSWQQRASIDGLINTGGNSSAADGDLDIAYALLLASAQWGNDGGFDYAEEAGSVIDAIADLVVHPTLHTVMLGDWAGGSSAAYAESVRTSDWMTQHFKEFLAASGDARWQAVLDATYLARAQLVANHSPATGLLPDFAVRSAGTYIPAAPNFLESDYDGAHNWNAVRDPWRLGTDLVTTGEPSLTVHFALLNDWIRTSTAGNPAQIMPGYLLNGTPITTEYRSVAFAAPFTVAAMADPANQQWLNSLWTHVVTRPAEGYYADSIRLLSLIVASGNWWAPSDFAGPDPVPNTFSILSKKVNRKTGTAKLKIRTAAPGRIEVLKTGNLRKASASVPASLRVTLTVRPRGTAAKKLRQGQAVRVSVKLRFSPVNGTPRTRTVKIKLRRNA